MSDETNKKSSVLESEVVLTYIHETNTAVSEMKEDIKDISIVQAEIKAEQKSQGKKIDKVDKYFAEKHPDEIRRLSRLEGAVKAFILIFSLLVGSGLIGVIVVNWPKMIGG